MSDRGTCFRGDGNRKYNRQACAGPARFQNAGDVAFFARHFLGAGSITLVAGGRRDRLTTRIANTGGSSRRVITRRNAARKTLLRGSQEWVSSQGLERIGVESSSRSL